MESQTLLVKILEGCHLFSLRYLTISNTYTASAAILNCVSPKLNESEGFTLMGQF